MQRVIPVLRATLRSPKPMYVASPRAMRRLPASSVRPMAMSLRSYASETATPPPGASQHPLMKELQQHPEVMKQLLDFTAFLQTKGVDPTGQNMSYIQMMKIMQDPEVKERAQKLGMAIQEAGIQLDLSMVADLQKSLGGQQPAKEKNDGVVNKMKGFFKK
ncbi:hypothetical protein BC940DRAFT_312090 [Gongronella butleri]|nr:hypothetical protein BC940DRAFT_312090 [Gongronella butleri]